MVGASVGCAVVGVSVGSAVGSSVGAPDVGASVGDVGVPVGASVGAAVGVVGVPVGAKVGAVGVEVGRAVGSNVGWAVGALVQKAVHRPGHAMANGLVSQSIVLQSGWSGTPLHDGCDGAAVGAVGAAVLPVDGASVGSAVGAPVQKAWHRPGHAIANGLVEQSMVLHAGSSARLLHRSLQFLSPVPQSLWMGDDRDGS